MSFGYQVLGFGAHVQGGVSPLLTDLVAYWSMDEASGTRADSHTNGYNLTDNNTAGAAAGVQGNAASFVSANSEYLSHADNADFSAAGTDVSWFGWFKTTAGGLPGIVCKDAGTSNRQYRIFLFSHGLYCLIMDNGAAAGQAGPSGFTAQNGAWHSFYADYSPTGQEVRVIMDDGTPATVAYSSGMADSSAALEIPRYNVSAYTDIDVDEVGMWHRKLTAAEITWLHNSGSGRSWSDIQAYSP